MQWGAWGGSGMATRVRGFMDRMARMGLGVLQPAQGLAVVGRVLAAAASPFRPLSPVSPVLVGAYSGQPQIAWRHTYFASACHQSSAVCFSRREAKTLRGILFDVL